ncbi:Potassium voltage-gated channel subfamily H member 7 [Fasciola hepatica]|uniref:Potassium voltage-gated channel subfamily H member 7 n=1 Tax=Fasciola hepatica TaxID=6192 RepID=A0A4E0QX73_FASHE|nr:Potassium voltage-gated channel subfamily H member 7 [Fasciola hepatica]
MPVKRGHVAPQNTFIDTLIQRFDSQRRKFLIANAVLPQTPIIFCNDDLCHLCGYSRAEILQRSAALEFLYGPLTSSKAIGELKRTLTECEERLILAILYDKSGRLMVCT